MKRDPKTFNRQPRLRFSQEHSERLLELYSSGVVKPNKALRESLALELDKTPRSIQIWFQNKRAKSKQQLLDSDSSPSSLTPLTTQTQGTQGTQGTTQTKKSNAKTSKQLFHSRSLTTTSDEEEFSQEFGVDVEYAKVGQDYNDISYASQVDAHKKYASQGQEYKKYTSQVESKKYTSQTQNKKTISSDISRALSMPLSLQMPESARMSIQMPDSQMQIQMETNPLEGVLQNTSSQETLFSPTLAYSTMSLSSTLPLSSMSQSLSQPLPLHSISQPLHSIPQVQQISQLPHTQPIQEKKKQKPAPLNLNFRTTLNPYDALSTATSPATSHPFSPKSPRRVQSARYTPYPSPLDALFNMNLGPSLAGCVGGGQMNINPPLSFLKRGETGFSMYMPHEMSTTPTHSQSFFPSHSQRLRTVSSDSLREKVVRRSKSDGKCGDSIREIKEEKEMNVDLDLNLDDPVGFMRWVNE